ncbi:MAG: hypothetical protein M3P38_03265 [Chloroflexota bacterium]|nr:hypothetical protein [Chloroflexota bacterium]
MRPPRRDDTIAIPISAIRRILVALAALAVVLLVAIVLWQQVGNFLAGQGRRVDRNTYQAVFLLSSQVYFGHLTIEGDEYLLRDVFYLNAPAEGSQRGQLVKRGNELHGPTEPMIVPARSVLFWENMREDSEVAGAIRLYRSGQVPSPLPVTPAPSTAVPTPTASRSPSPSPSPSR